MHKEVRGEPHSNGEQALAAVTSQQPDLHQRRVLRAFG